MVSPEPPDDTGQILRQHTLLLSRARQREQLPGVVLGTAVSGQRVAGAHAHPTGQRQGGGLRNGPRLECSQLPQHKACPEVLWEEAGAGESTSRAGGVGKVNLQIAHGFDNGHNGLDGVAVDDRPVLSALLLRVAILVDDPGSQGARVRVYQARGPPVGIRSYGGLQ